MKIPLSNTIACYFYCPLNFWWITYLKFGGQQFRQAIGIPVGTNCAPILADLFLYSYEKEFLDKLIKEGRKKAC